MSEVNLQWPGGGSDMAALIRTFDWATTPLGPVATWSERLKLMVEQVLASPLVSSLVCGPERVLVYNDAAARLYGNRHPAALARSLPETFPEGWTMVTSFYERAFAGETVQVSQQPLDTRGEGEATDVFDALLTPVRESNGQVTYVHMTGFEVGDRVRTEAARRESETRHRLLIESWAQAEWETDAAGVVTADSPSWRAYTGQTLDEWLGYGWLDAIHPDDRAYAERQWREAVAARGLVNAEFRLQAPNNGWRWTNVRAAPVLDAGGSIEKWVGMNIDINASKRAEASLRESEKRYRTLFESMDEAYAVVEVLKDQAGEWIDFRFVEVNPAFVEHTSMPWPVGKIATELLGSPNPRWTQLYGQALDTDAPIRVEEDEPTLGRIFDLNIFALERDRNRVAVLFTNITPRKKVEAALRESEERFQHVVRATRDIVWDIDLASDRVWWSEALQTELGFSADEIGPDTAWCFAHMHPDDRERVVTSMKEAAAGTGHAWSDEFRYRRADDTYAHVADRGFITRDASGRALRMTGAMQDVTVRKEAQDVLRTSEERQGFLLKLSDILQQLSQANDIKAAATSVLGRHLGVSRAQYHEVDSSGEYYDADGVGYADGLPLLDLKYRIDQFGSFVAEDFEAGRPFRSDDLLADPRPTAEEREAYGVYQIRAGAGIPLLRGGKLVAILAVHDMHPHAWTDLEMELIRETAERIWVAVEKARTGIAVRESEERQAFLLKLSDALRHLSEPLAIQHEASRILRQQLGAIRVAYAEMRPDDRTCTLLAENIIDGAVSLVGMVADWDDFDPTAHAASKNGQTFVREDLRATSDLTAEQKAAFSSLNVRGFITTPLVKSGRLVAFFVAQFEKPRERNPNDIAIVEETAERTWAAVERACAEAALRESEERFAQFAASSSDTLWIRDAATLTMEYVSPSAQATYGVSPADILGEVGRWAALIVPEDRGAAQEQLERARSGEATVHEFRVRRPSDGEERWIRNTNFPLYDEHGHVRRVGGIAEDVTEAREMRERQAVLVAELQHRTRNLMGVVRSMADRTGEASRDLKDFRIRFRDRLEALARVQGLLSRLGETDRIAFDELIRTEIKAMDGAAERVTLDGPSGIRLRSSMVQTLAMALHELATNAVKYGALSQPQAELAIRWRLTPPDKRGRPWLHIDWRESGVRMPPTGAVPQGNGQGRELIEEALPYQLDAETSFALGPDGVHCTLSIPVSASNVEQEHIHA